MLVFIYNLFWEESRINRLLLFCFTETRKSGVEFPQRDTASQRTLTTRDRASKGMRVIIFLLLSINQITQLLWFTAGHRPLPRYPIPSLLSISSLYQTLFWGHPTILLMEVPHSVFALKPCCLTRRWPIMHGGVQCTNYPHFGKFMKCNHV